MHKAKLAGIGRLLNAHRSKRVGSYTVDAAMPSQRHYHVAKACEAVFKKASLSEHTLYCEFRTNYDRKVEAIDPDLNAADYDNGFCEADDTLDDYNNCEIYARLYM